MDHFMVHIKNFLDTLHVSFFFGIMQTSNGHIFIVKCWGRNKVGHGKESVGSSYGGASMRFENANHGKYWWRSRHYLALLVHVVLKKDY
jgi:hypothetical protein